MVEDGSRGTVDERAMQEGADRTPSSAPWPTHHLRDPSLHPSFPLTYPDGLAAVANTVVGAIGQGEEQEQGLLMSYSGAPDEQLVQLAAQAAALALQHRREEVELVAVLFARRRVQHVQAELGRQLENAAARAAELEVRQGSALSWL